MVAGNVANIRRVPGRVVINPTDLQAEYPYGGIEVGRTNLHVILPLGEQFLVRDEGLGEIVDVLEGNLEYVFTCFMRGWDDDAVRLIHSGQYQRGETTQRALFNEPGGTTPGVSALSRAVTFLLVPDDPVRTPGLIIYRGVPDWASGAEIAFQRNEDLGLAISLQCVRDTAGRTLSIGYLPDFTIE